jgi:hypothetical protein
MIRKVVAAVTLVILSSFTAASAYAQVEARAGDGEFRYTKIYADSTGASHFSDEYTPLSSIDFAPPLPPVAATSPLPASNLMVLAVPGGAVADWHPVPRRQINIILTGEVEIKVSDGETRRFGPGSWILGEDTWGQGHITRVVSNETTLYAVITLDSQ